ncbi:MAG TPA: M13 family metallopeptidase [Steroidobacteraceae bacterium]|nr:M13 family metallopeptidase [Steroidobacteraceae bacterium]
MSHRTRLLVPLALLAVAAAAAAAPSGPRPAGEPLYPPAGIDMSGTDPAVRPGDSFFDYCNGAWIARTAIPADLAAMTSGQMMRDQTELQVRGLIEAAAQQPGHEPTSVAGKVGAFYRAFMDETRVNARRARPLSPELDAIRASRHRADLAALMGHSAFGFEGGFFRAGIDVDLKDTSRYAVYLTQAGLSLPDRDYYLKSELAPQKAALGTYVERLLTLGEWPEARAEAERIVALETRIAEASWTKVEQRDTTRIYNPATPAQLAALAPGFPWAAYLRGAGLGAKARVIVAEQSAFPKIAQVFATTPLPTLRAWLAFTVLDAAAPYLAHDFVAARFALRDEALQGIRQPPPRWKLGVRAVAGGDCGAAPESCFGTLNWAVGELYTARYFPPATKASIQTLVAEVMRAYRARIERLDWMGEATRAEALRKLDTYVVKVGYPDKPRDYSHVVIRDDDLVGDVRRAAAADWAFYLGRSAGPVDKSDWGMTPQTVDAYNGSLRDIVVPAAILQPPNFDPGADAAVNFGGIATIIGHELTHGFDDEGRTLDATGALRDWWTEADARAFKERAAVLGAQFATYEPVAGLHINPDLTMGENLADLGGLMIALDAYHASLHGAAAPLIDGLSGDQRFFRAYAQIWRGKAREDSIRQQTVSNPHSWRRFRVDGIVRNVDAWYAAFDVQPGDRLYVEPAKRARVW